ncbi:hypothetical protein [Nocardia tengchongensis]|uniref:hypothetical protein n=1 Tax=Nocardia tengchongensis TaxID=2055889 RepID=UPI003616A30C
MTSPVSITARNVLFGSAGPAAVRNELATLLHASGAGDLALRWAAGVTAAVRSAVPREVAGAVDTVLAVDLGGVARTGWQRYRRLHEAAVRTRSGGVEQVDLYEHEITQTCRPRVEVTIDGNRVGEFELELCVAELLRPLTATVRDGLLVALGPGDCRVTVSMDAPEAGPIVERERTFPIATLVDLRRPIPLLAHH